MISDLMWMAMPVPVKAEVEKVAARHGLAVTIVSNGGLRPSANPLLRHVTVAEGADAADDWIVEHIAAGDIAITADIPLAARCLDKGARVLGPNGKPFTPGRHRHGAGDARTQPAFARTHAGGQTHHAGFGKQDRSRFLGELENCIAGAETRRLAPCRYRRLRPFAALARKCIRAAAGRFLYQDAGGSRWASSRA